MFIRKQAKLQVKIFEAVKIFILLLLQMAFEDTNSETVLIATLGV